MKAVADNNILALFVDSGREELLYQIVGQLVEPEAIISPDPQNTSSEFNRRSDIPGRLDFIRKHETLWVSVALTVEEIELVVTLANQCKRLKHRWGDLEVLVLALQRGYTLLTEDNALREEAQKRGVKVKGSCGLLVEAVKKSILTCEKAAELYNNVFKKELGLYSKLEFRCPEGNCVQAES